MPKRIFLLFHRYAFILTDEAERTVRAVSLRAFGGGIMNIRTYVSLVSQLLLRTLGRAERIYHAMLCRGFDGKVPLMRKLRTGAAELAFVAGWTAVFVLFRYCNIPLKIGAAVSGVFR